MQASGTGMLFSFDEGGRKYEIEFASYKDYGSPKYYLRERGSTEADALTRMSFISLQWPAQHAGLDYFIRPARFNRLRVRSIRNSSGVLSFFALIASNMASKDGYCRRNASAPSEACIWISAISMSGHVSGVGLHPGVKLIRGELFAQFPHRFVGLCFDPGDLFRCEGRSLPFPVIIHLCILAVPLSRRSCHRASPRIARICRVTPAQPLESAT